MTPDQKDNLPPLPKPSRFFGHSRLAPMYSADEMREYALLARAEHEAGKGVRPKPKFVGDPELDTLIRDPSPAFEAWRDTLKPEYWAHYDISAVRLGYEIGRRILPKVPNVTPDAVVGWLMETSDGPRIHVGTTPPVHDAEAPINSGMICYPLTKCSVRFGPSPPEPK